MEKVENQFDWQIIFGPKKIIGIGVLVIVTTLTSLYGVWASSIPLLGMIIIGFILIGLGTAGLIILLMLYFAEIRTKKKLLGLRKDLGVEPYMGIPVSPKGELSLLKALKSHIWRKQKDRS